MVLLMLPLMQVGSAEVVQLVLLECCCWCLGGLFVQVRFAEVVQIVFA